MLIRPGRFGVGGDEPRVGMNGLVGSRAGTTSAAELIISPSLWPPITLRQSELADQSLWILQDEAAIATGGLVTLLITPQKRSAGKHRLLIDRPTLIHFRQPNFSLAIRRSAQRDKRRTLVGP
jgi:hypothetical protein